MLNVRKFQVGINLVPQNSEAPSAAGDIIYNSSISKLELYNGSVDPIVTEADTATLTNKTVSLSANTISSSTNSVIITNSSGIAIPLAQTTAPTVLTSINGVPSWLSGYPVTVTATSAGTVSLVAGSNQNQVFTGTNTETVILPNATTMSIGAFFNIFNQSTGALTLEFNGGSPFTDAAGVSHSTVSAGTSLTVTLQTNGTSAGTWAVTFSSGSATIAGVSPTVSTVSLTSHTGGFSANGSGTYTVPAGVQYIRVRMVGGGGGGSGSAVGASGTAATDGGSTTFGSSLLTCNGGIHGVVASTGGAGGSVTLSSPAIGTSITGGSGGGAHAQATSPTTAVSGPVGGDAPYFGGGGRSQRWAGTAQSGTANTGGGGQGGGADNVTNLTAGAGGGSGGFIEAIIFSPLATYYAYAVGAGGSAGAAGTSGSAGGAGGSGYIEVTEYYTALAVGTTTNVSSNLVLAGPSSGSAALPTFRSLVPADTVYAINNQTASYALTASDQTVAFSTGSSALAATLPTAVGISGKIYNLVKTDTGSGTVNLTTTSSQTIGGLASTKILLASQNDSIQVVSDGSNWQIIEMNIDVAMRWSNTSSTVTSTPSIVKFGTNNIDTYEQYSSSTGNYTIVLPGRYQVSASLYILATYAANNSSTIRMYHNGSLYTSGRAWAGAATNTELAPILSDIVQCAAGDTISIYGVSQGTSPSYDSSPDACFFCVTRIGN